MVGHRQTLCRSSTPAYTSDRLHINGWRCPIPTPLAIVLLLLGAITASPLPLLAQTPTSDLSIKKVSEHLYVHVSTLDIKNYGTFPCNGAVFVSNGEAVVFDTPVSEEASKKLNGFVTDSLQATIKAVVVNHYHVDCLGGLSVFHDLGIESYSSERTRIAAQQDSVTVPMNSFETFHVLSIGEMRVINAYLGHAHSADNIVSYIPSERALFGGCMIKELNAGKGNLNDADIEEWPKTVQRVAEAFPLAEVVIPGHGEVGTRKNFGYTITLMQR